MELDKIDKDLLNIIQLELPLSREPFVALDLRLGIGSDEIIRRIEQLKMRGIIRLIGPVFNPRRLGYRTTLVAMKLQEKQLDMASQIISANPMVSHCYERDHDLNFWFTLAMPEGEDMDTEVRKLGDRLKSETTLNLSAVKTFKIGAYFNLDGHTKPVPAMSTYHSGLSDTDFELSAADRTIINVLQQDLPLNEKPFDIISARLAMDADEFLGHCQALLLSGIMRRFSASISHNKLGFLANAMACWKVPSDMVDAAGKKIAAITEISHCYERRTNSLWRYNLFAMIHAETEETCRAITDKICADTGLDRKEMILLFSTKEIKKTRVQYKV